MVIHFHLLCLLDKESAGENKQLEVDVDALPDAAADVTTKASEQPEVATSGRCLELGAALPVQLLRRLRHASC